MRDGQSQGRCETTHTERFAYSKCTCETYAGNLGPCQTWEEGASGRCVYCEHDKTCHAGLVAARELAEKTSEYADILVSGVRLLSRYCQNDEFVRMAILVIHFPAYWLPVVDSIYCDSKATHTYVVTLRERHQNIQCAAALLEYMDKLLFKHVGGYNGISIERPAKSLGARWKGDDVTDMKIPPRPPTFALPPWAICADMPKESRPALATFIAEYEPAGMEDITWRKDLLLAIADAMRMFLAPLQRATEVDGSRWISEDALDARVSETFSVPSAGHSS